tara:strand:+ start:4702 stop:4914 length:213 start_codon:yes stop_codon:yes gene_type:complete
MFSCFIRTFGNKTLLIAPIAVQILCCGGSQKQRIATNSGREVLMEIIRSAPKKKLPNGQLLVVLHFALLI